MKSYLRRVFRQAFGMDVTREFPMKGTSFQVTQRPGRVLLAINAPEALELEIPLTPRTAWLLGGRLMDTATKVSQDADKPEGGE